MIYAVITKIPNAGEGEAGNLAMPMLWQVDIGPDDSPRPVHPGLLIVLRAEVFIVGELLVLDAEHGREVLGAGRKPSKWEVDVEHFESIEDAIVRAREVRSW